MEKIIKISIETLLQEEVVKGKNTVLHLTIERNIYSNVAILGTCSIGKTEICKTLELPWLKNQQFISCIPEGTYEFERHKRGIILLDVPGRYGILMHIANRTKEIQGCIAPGLKWGFLNQELAVLSSKKALTTLMQYSAYFIHKKFKKGILHIRPEVSQS